MSDNSRTTSWWPVVVAGLWLLAAVLVLVAVVVTRSDDATLSYLPPANTVRLEPVTYRNDAAFTDSVTAVPLEALPELVAKTKANQPAPATGPVDGHTALLYASRGPEPVCKAAALSAALAADSTLASAWANAAHVDTSAIDATIASLTPVVLTRDTAVTNHIYTSGKPRAYQAVLQSGTPVMVDATGVPRVQCSCGNPLGNPAEQRPATTDGHAWDNFDTAAVAVVTPAAAPAPQLETIDLDTAQPSTTPTGTNAALSGTLVAADDGLQVITADNQTVKVLDESLDAVFDDGRGGLYYTLADPGNPFRNTRPATIEASAIWYLAPGATEAVQAVPAAPGRWNRLLGVGHLGDRTYVVFNSLTLDLSIPEEPFASGSTIARDVDSGTDTVVAENSEGWESGAVATSFGGDRLGISLSQEINNVWLLLGPGLQPLTTACGSDDLDAPQAAKACPDNGALDEAGNIVAMGDQDEQVPHTLLTSDPVTAQKGATVTLAPTARNGEFYTNLHQALSGRVVISTPTGNETNQEETKWQVFDRSSGAEVTPDLGGRRVRQLRLLTAPIIRPQAAPAPATPRQASYHAPSVEEIKAGVPAAVCDSGTPVRLDEQGHGQNMEDYTDESFRAVSVDPAAVVTVDVDGDGTPETVIAGWCNQGGSGYGTPVAALRSGPNGVEVLGEVDQEFGRESRAIEKVTAVAGGVQVSGPRWTEGDAACCASDTFTTTLRFSNGAWHEG